MQRFVCIHGHFYQPPREQPWLEAVERQESAYPYHDWNRRITAECYAPNASSRILDEQGRITRIVNNYARISFNVGPTLLSWLQAHEPSTYQAILDADVESRERYGGHGSAMAQVYNHAILPLCNPRDRETQVVWGLADFRRRFGREPEGMWLPETAVDTESLETLARHGVRFTVLAPSQATHVRPIGGRRWRPVGAPGPDPRRPYRLTLPSGKTIDLFFYDGPVSRAVAFEQLLSRGEDLANRLVHRFGKDDGRPQLVHIATDGESYGHHHRHGDMALAYALHYIEAQGLARCTNYGQFLDLCPPTDEVRLREESSWSCVHGLGRWKEDCGCSSEYHEGWTQSWRGPLREALDWLRDELAPRYAREAAILLGDPWAARDRYIDVVLDRDSGTTDRFLRECAGRELSEAETTRALELLELQRQAMLMYTSCGWFFEEPSRLETVQILRYAGRGLQLIRRLFDEDLEPGFLERLRRGPSNLAEFGDLAGIYSRKVRPARVDLRKVGANFAAGLLFDSGERQESAPAFSVDCLDCRNHESGRSRLVVGRMRVASRITRNSEDLTFGVLHLGDHNLNGGVRPYRNAAAYETMIGEVGEAFSRGDLSEVLRRLDEHFLELTYSLKTLFRDQQSWILERVLESALRESETVHRQLYDSQASLIRFLGSLDAPLPPALRASSDLVQNAELRRALDEARPDPDRLRPLVAEALSGCVAFDREGLAFAAQEALERLFAELAEDPGDLPRLERLAGIAELFRELPFEIEWGGAQNAFYRLLQTEWPRRRDEGGDWPERFAGLGVTLQVAVE